VRKVIVAVASGWWLVAVFGVGAVTIISRDIIIFPRDRLDGLLSLSHASEQN